MSVTVSYRLPLPMLTSVCGSSQLVHILSRYIGFCLLRMYLIREIGRWGSGRWEVGGGRWGRGTSNTKERKRVHLRKCHH